MKKEFKNFGYMLAGVIIATLLLNPTFANQISSNLVKGFVAITSTDTKGENNLVGLDAGGKLPTDIIPASAVGGGDSIVNKFVQFVNIYSYDSSYSCPTGYDTLGESDDDGHRDARVKYATSWRNGTDDNAGFVINELNIGKQGCRMEHNERDYDNLSNKTFYSDERGGRCNIVKVCLKIY